MKNIITLALIVPTLAYAGGMTIFEKATGTLLEVKTQTVLFDSDNSTKVIGTNTITAWQKVHPQIRARGNTAEGQQVLVPIDWKLFDVATFDTATENPLNTNDLTGVVVADVSGEREKSVSLDAEKLTLRNEAEQSLIATAVSLGITNRPVPMTVVGRTIKQLAQTDPQTAIVLSATVQADTLTFTLNGGDIWKIGAAK
jgi:hypothetical protein